MKHEFSGTKRISSFRMHGLGTVSTAAEGRLIRSPAGECLIAGFVNKGGGRFRWDAPPGEDFICLPPHSVCIEAPDADVRSRVFYRDGFEPDAPLLVLVLENGQITQRIAGPLDTDDWEDFR